MFHDRSLLERCFRVFSFPFWSTVLQCGDRLPMHTLNYCTVQSVVPGSYLAHRRSVAVLCMLYKIRCNPIHPLNDTLPRPYVPVRVTRGALVAHRFTYAPPRCRTSQYHRIFVSLSVSLWNDLADPVFDVWDWLVWRAGPMFFNWPKLLYPDYSLLLFFLFSSSCL